MPENTSEKPVIACFEMGNYLSGFPNTQGTSSAQCRVTDDTYDFYESNYSYQRFGYIPRNSVNDVLIDSKMQITQRLTVTRMVTLGIFSLAVPKKKKHEAFCLLIDWEDENGLRQNTIFEFDNKKMAMNAHNKIATYKKLMVPATETYEKKCPYCAETIKKEAIVCRYCQRNL